MILTPNIFVLIYYTVYLMSFVDCALILKFDRIPSGASLAGLACAIEKCGTGLSRGVKFDTVTRVCEPLLSSWFSNPIVENNTVYYKLRMMETSFVQKKSMVTILPPNFVLGSTLKYFVKTGGVVNKGRTALNIGKATSATFCFHSDMRHWVPSYLFRAYPGYAGPQVVKWSNPLKKAHTKYTMEFRVTSSAFKVYVDDSLIVTYGHRTNFFNCDRITFYSVHHCQRMQILYP